MKQVTTAIGLALVWLLAIAPAAAAQQNHYFQSYGTLFAGPGFGGALEGGVFATGASVSIHEDTGWGTEFDVAHAADNQSGVGHADLTSAMFNLIFTHPSPKFRPFGAAGLGWLRMQGCLDRCTDDVKVNDFGLQVGGGVVVRANDVAGLRVDARYVWAPGRHANRPDNYGYWRIGMGLTFMWATEP